MSDKRIGLWLSAGGLKKTKLGPVIIVVIMVVVTAMVLLIAITA